MTHKPRPLLPCLVGRSKINLILEFLNIAPEVSVVVSDIDTAWLRNPFPFFRCIWEERLCKAGVCACAALYFVIPTFVAAAQFSDATSCS